MVMQGNHRGRASIAVGDYGIVAWHAEQKRAGVVAYMRAKQYVGQLVLAQPYAVQALQDAVIFAKRDSAL